MQKIGEKIRELRKRKRLTQEQLAEVLAVSFQTISKWENGVNTPDISMLPILAGFFGVSMDELFGFKLENLQYKDRFIKFLADNGVLHFGDFELQSGRRSPYYIDETRYKSGSQLNKLGMFYAECIERNKLEVKVLFGNEWNGQALSVATAMTLFHEYGKDVEYGFLQSKNDKMSMTGKRIGADDNVTILCDTITSGETIRNTVKLLKEHYGANVSNIIVSLDRMEIGENGRKTALQELREELGVTIISMITFDDIIDAVQSGIIAGQNYLSDIKLYKKNYCR